MLLKTDLSTMTLADALVFYDEIGDDEISAWRVVPRSLIVDPDGSSASIAREDLFAEPAIREILQIDLTTMEVTDRGVLPDEYWSIAGGAMGLDGRTAYFASYAGVFEFDVERMAATRFLEMEAGGGTLLVSSDGEHLYHVGQQGVARVELAELLVTGFYVGPVGDQFHVNATAALSPDDRILFLVPDGPAFGSCVCA